MEGCPNFYEQLTRLSEIQYRIEAKRKRINELDEIVKALDVEEQLDATITNKEQEIHHRAKKIKIDLP